MEGHASCAQYLRKSGLPLILLGGGGYTIKNVARAWAYETACALNIEDTIDRNLPWNSYFEWFGPRYRLEVAENNMEDLNPKDGYLDSIKCEPFFIFRSTKSHWLSLVQATSGRKTEIITVCAVGSIAISAARESGRASRT